MARPRRHTDMRRRILDTVKQLRNEYGMTVLYTTHLMEEAQELSDRVGIIDYGEIIALGTLTTTDGGTSRSFVPGDYYSGNFTFQVGAFLKHENAERLKHKLNEKYQNAHITTYDDGKNIYYRVRVGKATNLEQAAEFERYLIQNGFPGAFIVAE